MSPVQYQTCLFHASNNALHIAKEQPPPCLKVVQRPAPHHCDGSHARTADLITLLGQFQEGRGQGGRSSRSLDLGS